MSTPSPTCAIVLQFYEDDGRFSYYCAASSRGWQVQPNGSIHPPSRSRIVQFSLQGFPSSAVFAGFQAASSPGDLPPQSIHWPPLPDGVTVLSPTPYPPANDTTLVGPLVFDLGDQAQRVFYRLAVVVESDPEQALHWDDPKIYDDGSE
jgi:hypothetical protein